VLILKSLTFSGIGRFVDEQTIDFTTLGSLVQIDGENKNTGGSSGSGKSTVFKALEYLLGLNDISNGILQSRLTKEAMSVMGHFDWDGIPVKIQRNKKLLVDIDGVPTIGSSKITEEKLDEIIGMPRDLFRKILHKRQGEGGFFLDLGPSDVHKFLTSCLSLQKEQAKISVLDARLEDLLKSEILYRSRLESNKMGLEATKNAKVSLGPIPVLEVDPGALGELEIQYAKATETHKLTRETHDKEMVDLEQSRPQTPTVPFDRAPIEKIENEINTILTQIAKLQKVESDRQAVVKANISEIQIQINKLNSEELTRQSEVRSKISSAQAEISRLQGLEQVRQAAVQSEITFNNISLLRAKIESVDGGKAKVSGANLAIELNKIRASLCPTCEQGWVNDAAKAKESDILAKLQECKKLVIAGIAADKEKLILEEKLKQLNLEFQPRIVPEIQILNNQIVQLRIDSNPKIPEEIQVLNEKIFQLRIDCPTPTTAEIIDLRLQKDFKNKELTDIRQEERDHQFKEDAKKQVILVNYALKQTELRKSHEITAKFLQDEESKALAEYVLAKNKVKSFEENKKP